MNAALKPIFLDKPTVLEVTSLAEATLELEIREGRFPKPRQISGRRVAWLLSEVEAWALERPVSSLPPPPNTGHRNRRKKTEPAESA